MVVGGQFRVQVDCYVIWITPCELHLARVSLIVLYYYVTFYDFGFTNYIQKNSK